MQVQVVVVVKSFRSETKILGKKVAYSNIVTPKSEVTDLFFGLTSLAAVSSRGL